MYEIEVENKNIIITDPCYLGHVMDERDNTSELTKYWDKMFNKINGDFCNGLSDFNFNNYICCGTKYGDWSCYTYRTNINPTTLKTLEDLKTFEKNEDKTKIGEFCADAGMVCVVDMDDLKKFNPHFFEWAFFHSYCVTAIHNFTGTIGIHDIDPHYENFPYYRIRLVYGIGDKEKNSNAYNFCSL